MIPAQAIQKEACKSSQTRFEMIYIPYVMKSMVLDRSFVIKWTDVGHLVWWWRRARFKTVITEEALTKPTFVSTEAALAFVSGASAEKRCGRQRRSCLPAGWNHFAMSKQTWERKNLHSIWETCALLVESRLVKGRRSVVGRTQRECERTRGKTTLESARVHPTNAKRNAASRS
jgi:hypothetical protein